MMTFTDWFTLSRIPTRPRLVESPELVFLGLIRRFNFRLSSILSFVYALSSWVSISGSDNPIFIRAMLYYESVTF